MTDIADKCPGCLGCPVCFFVMLRKLEQSGLAFERQSSFQWKDPSKERYKGPAGFSRAKSAHIFMSSEALTL
jgi:hypothetical protein